MFSILLRRAFYGMRVLKLLFKVGYVVAETIEKDTEEITGSLPNKEKIESAKSFLSKLSSIISSIEEMAEIVLTGFKSFKAADFVSKGFNSSFSAKFA